MQRWGSAVSQIIRQFSPFSPSVWHQEANPPLWASVPSRAMVVRTHQAPRAAGKTGGMWHSGSQARTQNQEHSISVCFCHKRHPHPLPIHHPNTQSTLLRLWAVSTVKWLSNISKYKSLSEPTTSSPAPRPTGKVYRMSVWILETEPTTAVLLSGTAPHTGGLTVTRTGALPGDPQHGSGRAAKTQEAFSVPGSLCSHRTGGGSGNFSASQPNPGPAQQRLEQPGEKLEDQASFYSCRFELCSALLILLASHPGALRREGV